MNLMASRQIEVQTISHARGARRPAAQHPHRDGDYIVAVIGSPLTFLSWNLAMLERSQEAPPVWGQEHTQAEVRRVVLDVSPDIVLFQELPGIVPYVETHDMVRSNPMSHSGNLATLVGHDLMEEQLTVTTVPGVAVLTTFVERDVTVANVHLAPGRSGASDRIEQLRAVVETAPTNDVAVIGDTNTRTGEEAAIGGLGLQGARPPQPTWDSRRNRFRGESSEFVAYFTRFFVHGGLRIDQLSVLTDGVIGLDGRAFQVSDHFALSGAINATD